MGRISYMCSPAMKCGLHRQNIPKPAAPPVVRSDNGLMRPQLSRSNSCRKADSFSSSSSSVLRRSRSVANINPAEVARRAVRLSCRARGPQKIRRRNFETRPSRLSKVSTAADS